MNQYDGKRIVITGGGSGMGLATAKLLLSQGAQVMITGRTKAALELAREELGENAIVTQSDATSLTDMDALADRVKRDYGSIDALMICAGETRFVPFESVTEAMYDELLAVNAKGAYFTVQKLAPLIKAGGAVVFVTSVSNVLGIPLISAYSASKAALRSMTRTLARELMPREIRVNAVSPGPIDSGILEKTMPKAAAVQARQQMTESNPMKRFGRSEEVAKALVFLAFEATYTTGAELAVDGGGSQL